MLYTIVLPPDQMQATWNALMEQPAKVVFGTLTNMKGQMETQEKAFLATQQPLPLITPPGEAGNEQG